MTKLYEKFFYKYDTDPEFSATYTGLRAVYILGLAAGVLHIIDAALMALVFKQAQDKLKAEDKAGDIEQPETCCGSCGDTMLTSVKRISKILEIALASLCQYLLFNYGVEWVYITIIRMIRHVFSFPDIPICSGQASRCS